MSLDEVCDHTKGISDDEILDYYTDVLNNAGMLLYGKTASQYGWKPSLIELNSTLCLPFMQL